MFRHDTKRGFRIFTISFEEGGASDSNNNAEGNEGSSCFSYINANFERETCISFRFAKVFPSSEKARDTRSSSKGWYPEKKEIREKEKKETLIIFEGVGIGEAQIGRTIFRGDTTGLN